MAFEKWLFYNS